LIQDQNCQNKASQASCTLSTWLHAHQPFMIPAPSSQSDYTISIGFFFGIKIDYPYYWLSGHSIISHCHPGS
jgi:hypothetical protein